MPDNLESGKISLLHIDDCEDYLMLIRARLGKLADDIEIVSAADVDSAITAMRERDFSCILCDYQMPDMDGLQLLRTLRESGNATPFIILTSRDDESLEHAALRNGAFDYIRKEIGRQMYERILASVRRTSERLKNNRDTSPSVAGMPASTAV